MKKLISLLALTLCMSSFAQDRVELNTEKVNVDSAEAILVRNAQTPEVVHITFKVPMSESVCQSYSTRLVIVTSGMQCGYDQRVTGYSTRTVCVRVNPHNNQCLRTETQRLPVVQRYPRTCQVSETYCSSYGTFTNYESDEVKVKFKKLPDLGGTEEDMFLVKARQRSYSGENVVYDITPIQTVAPYEVKSKGLFGFDSYVIEVK
jgi:hypothetical protein